MRHLEFAFIFLDVGTNIGMPLGQVAAPGCPMAALAHWREVRIGQRLKLLVGASSRAGMLATDSLFLHLVGTATWAMVTAVGVALLVIANLDPGMSAWS